MIINEKKYADITLEKEDKEMLQNTRHILLSLLEVSEKYDNICYKADGVCHDINEISQFIDFIEDFCFCDSIITLENGD